MGAPRLFTCFMSAVARVLLSRRLEERTCVCHVAPRSGSRSCLGPQKKSRNRRNHALSRVSVVAKEGCEMKCEEIRQSLNFYLDGVLTQQERAVVEAHLQGCKECSAELEALAGTIGLIRRLPVQAPDSRGAETILAAVEATDFRPQVGATLNCGRVLALVPDLLDRALTPSEKQALLTHLGQCGGCKRVVADQHEAQMAVSALPEVEAPEGLVSAIFARTTRASAPAYRVRPQPVRWGIVRWALAPVAAAIVVGVALFWPRGPQQVAFAPQPPAPLVTAPEAVEPAPLPGTAVAEAPKSKPVVAAAPKASAPGSRVERVRKPAPARPAPIMLARAPAVVPAAQRGAGVSVRSVSGTLAATTARTIRRETVPAGPAASVVAEAASVAAATPEREPLMIVAAAPAVRMVRAQPETAPAALAVEKPATRTVRAQPEEFALIPKRDYSLERLEVAGPNDRYASFEIALSSF